MEISQGIFCAYRSMVKTMKEMVKTMKENDGPDSSGQFADTASCRRPAIQKSDTEVANGNGQEDLPLQ